MQSADVARQHQLVATQVLASAAQCSLGHPLHHAAMVVIAAIAERDRRLWPEREAGVSLLQPDPSTATLDGHQSPAVNAGAQKLQSGAHLDCPGYTASCRGLGLPTSCRFPTFSCDNAICHASLP